MHTYGSTKSRTAPESYLENTSAKKTFVFKL